MPNKAATFCKCRRRLIFEIGKSMENHIKASRGYTKRKGERSQAQGLRIEVQAQSESSKDGAFAFKEKAPDFLVKPGFFAGVCVRISNEDSLSSLDALEEHSVTLTLTQTEALVAMLQQELDRVRKIAGKK